jgi:uncharacterized protein
MKIAIIGGGASGMIAAHLLDQQGHKVTVFESQSVLGGHIRTLNRNIQHHTNSSELLEAGVLEFPIEFKNFFQLMQDLEVSLEPVELGSGLFFQNGDHFLSPVMIEHNFHGLKKWLELAHIDGLYAQSLGLWLKTHLAQVKNLRGKSLSNYLSHESIATTWIKLLTMYSYSMPYETIDDFPAELAIPALRRYVFSNWFRIKGGVYSYIEKIVMRFSGEIFLNTAITEVRRSDNAVQIQGNISGSHTFNRHFDQVIFATPPDQVLPMLADARPEEIRRFQAWKPNHITTVLHSDCKLYAPHKIQHGSEFDFFQSGTEWGYNAALNQLCGITSNDVYSLGFNLKDQINPAKIIHIQQHHTPFYDVKSFQYRDEIIAKNGENNTYHVGAYLSDGLHEGAVTSAMNVAQMIGYVHTEDNANAASAQCRIPLTIH